MHGYAFSPDEKYILVMEEQLNIGNYPQFHRLLVFKTETGELYHTYDPGCYAESIFITPDSRYIICLTQSSGIVVLNGEGVFTSVEDSQPKNPLKTSIHPNPLQKSGIISYSVLKPELLKISVYDIFGREIVVLKNEFAEPGNYRIPFKSTEFSNGMYFLKVMNGGESSTTSFGILR